MLGMVPPQSFALESNDTISPPIHPDCEDSNQVEMSLSPMASRALQELEGLVQEPVSANTERSNTHDNRVQPERERDPVRVSLPPCQLPQPPPPAASMSTNASASESNPPSIPEPTPDDNKAARNARLAEARARKAQKGKRRKRRNRTAEEESAFWAALEAQGPKWTAIINEHGDSGTVDETLKGRDAMALRNKAISFKGNLIKAGDALPAYLQDLKVRDRPSTERSTQDSEEDEESRPRRAKRRSRQAAKEEEESKVKVKEEEPMVISDDDEDGDDRTNWNELPSSTPKSKRKRGAQSPTRTPEPADDPELEELRMIMITRRREEAEQAFRMRKAKLRRTHQR